MVHIKMWFGDEKQTVLVVKDDYIKAKTKDLIDFGYSSVTESDVAEQLQKILNNEEGLTVIGHFMKDDIVLL